MAQKSIRAEQKSGDVQTRCRETLFGCFIKVLDVMDSRLRQSRRERTGRVENQTREWRSVASGTKHVTFVANSSLPSGPVESNNDCHMQPPNDAPQFAISGMT